MEELPRRGYMQIHMAAAKGVGIEECHCAVTGIPGGWRVAAGILQGEHEPKIQRVQMCAVRDVCGAVGGVMGS